ncbi:alpha/beta hydrolase, partial [Acinetobacter baumannii]
DVSYKGAVAGAPASSLGTIIQIYIDPEMNQDSNFAVSKLDQAIRARRQIDAAIAAGQMSPNDPLALAVPTIDKTAEGYAELLAYAAFASAGIKAQQPDYDLKAIFTSGAAGIAELAYGRTGDDGACLSYPAPDTANGLQEKFKA